MGNNKTLYVIDLKDAFTPKIRKADKAFDKFDSRVKKSTSKSGGLGSFANLMTGGLLVGGVAALGVALVAGTKKIVDMGAAMEQTRISFEVLLGSKGASEKMVKNLNEFANVTPFVNKQFFDATKLLLNFGVSQKKILPTLKLLGDASGGVSERFQRMALAFGQINAAGRLMGQDLLQLINAGFNPLQEISKKTGKTMLQLKKDMEKGLISFDQVQQAFIDATKEGGRFFNLMEKQSKTFIGRMSTIAGKLQLVGISLGESLSNSLMPILEGINRQLDLMGDKIGTLDKDISKEINSFVDLRRNFLALTKEFTTLSLAEELTTDQRKRFEELRIQIAELVPAAAEFSKETGEIIALNFKKATESIFLQEKLAVSSLRSAVMLMEDEVERLDFRIKQSQAGIKGIETGQIAIFGDVDKTLLKANKSLLDLQNERSEAIRKLGKNTADLNKIERLGILQKRAEVTDLSKALAISNLEETGGIAGTAADVKAAKKTAISGRVAGISSGGIKNVTLNIDKLIEEITFSSTNMQEDFDSLKEKVTRILVEASTDATRLIGA